MPLLVPIVQFHLLQRNRLCIAALVCTFPACGPDMIEILQGGYSAAAEIMHLIPNWLITTALLTASVIVALLVYALIVGLMRRTFGARHPRLRTLLTNSKGPLRLGLTVLAMSLAVRVAPLSEASATIAGNILNVAFIALLGWIAATAVQISSQVYLLRFRLDTEDNLLARKHVTQVRILKRAVDVLIFVMTLAAALMTFDQVRQYGVSLFASAGVAGLAVGLAARPLLSNLIAGIQIAVAQPIRLDDVVIVENEWGSIEEITTTYVVIKLWDWRRLVVPLSYFIEKPFQNWTRETSALIGSVFLHVDYTAPIDKLREKLNDIVRASALWDGQVAVLQVSDAKDSTIEVRALVSARNAPASWDLRCEVREQLITYLQEHHPDALPRSRQLLSAETGHSTGSPSPSLVPSQTRENA
jgi:small-conductance mechanosensitive channel